MVKLPRPTDLCVTMHALASGRAAAMLILLSYSHMSKLSRDWPALLQRLIVIGSAIAAAAGVGVWAAILLAPKPTVAPPALVSTPELPLLNTEPIARWFGAAAAPTITLSPSGLIAAGNRGVAVLSIDGRRPQAYAVGQQLAADTWLVEVRPTGVVIRQGAQQVEIEVPRLPTVSGIVPYTLVTPGN